MDTSRASPASAVRMASTSRILREKRSNHWVIANNAPRTAYSTPDMSSRDSHEEPTLNRVYGECIGSFRWKNAAKKPRTSSGPAAYMPALVMRSMVTCRIPVQRPMNWIMPRIQNAPTDICATVVKMIIGSSPMCMMLLFRSP